MTPADIIARLVKPHTLERMVYDAMVWAVENPPLYGRCPDYTETGNSLAEEHARHVAAKIAAALDLAPVVALVEAATDAADIWRAHAGLPFGAMEDVCAALAAFKEKPE